MVFIIQSKEMASSTLVDFILDLIPQEHLISFFRHKKTEMAHGIDDPKLFLHQLRDHSLVPEDLCQVRYQEQCPFYNNPEFQELFTDVLNQT